MHQQTHTPSQGVQIIRASLELQQRIGIGPLDSGVVKRCQMVLDGNPTDFTPVARGFLFHLERAIGRADDETLPMQKRLDDLSKPVMELKANAKMFRYDLVTMLANIMLGFLESVSNLDKGAIEIVAAHHRTLAAIIDRKMTGDGGPAGAQLVQELKDACNRYFTRRDIRNANIGLV